MVSYHTPSMAESREPNTVGMVKPRKPLDRARWEQAALDAFERGGPAAISVVGLARELGVTKGSFYWHFESRGELLGAALERWEREHTTELLAALEDVEDPRERLVRLIRHSLETLWPTLFARLLAAAPDEPAVADVVSRATERRLAFLGRTYRELGLSAARAKRQALLAYAVYVGIATLTPSGVTPFPSARARSALAAHVIDVLVGGALDPGDDAGTA